MTGSTGIDVKRAGETVGPLIQGSIRTNSKKARGYYFPALVILIAGSRLIRFHRTTGP